MSLCDYRSSASSRRNRIESCTKCLCDRIWRKYRDKLPINTTGAYTAPSFSRGGYACTDVKHPKTTRADTAADLDIVNYFVQDWETWAL